MKKIMFNDKYGLTDAVLQGRKTMTRRMVPQSVLNAVEKYQEDYYSGTLESISTKDAILFMCTGEKMFKCIYNIGEVLAVAQRYSELSWDKRFYDNLCSMCEVLPQYELKGWDNKMFVRADLMPHQIRITDIEVERLQCISEDDCLKEGIYIDESAPRCYQPFYTFKNSLIQRNYLGWDNARDAFAALIDAVSGKGTWERNPWVFAYSFELVK